MGNKNKNKQLKITMKFTAAAILAIGAAATKITQYGGEGDLPFPPPECPPKPSKSEMYGATPEEVFDHIDADGSGLIDAHEGFNALYCMVEWGEMTREEAEGVFDMIDADGSGDIDEKEGKFALGCAVEWEFLTVEEAMWAAEFLSGHAGEDGKLDKAEAQAAMEELESME